MKIASLVNRTKQASGTPEEGAVRPRRDVPVQPSRRFQLGRTIAVHFDDQQLQLAVVSHKGPLRRLLHVRTEAFPGDLGDGQERDDFIGESVAHYVRKYGGLTPTVCLSIDGAETAARSMVLPDINSRSMKGAVSFEAKRQIPFSAEQAVFDYRVIRRLGTKEEPRAQVLLFAATQTCIAKHLQPLLDHGITVDRVNHSQDAVASLLRELPNFDPQEIYATVGLNNQRVEVSFYRGTSLRYWHVSRSTIGWPQTPDGRLDNNLAPLVGERIGQEVQLAMDFYTGKFSDNFNGKVMVFGGHVADSALLMSLHESTGLEFIRFPIEEIRFLAKNADVEPQTVLAALPVIAAATSDVALANLLPPVLRQSRHSRRINRMAIAGNAVLVLLLAASWYSLEHRAAYRDAHLSQLVESVRDTERSPAFQELRRVMWQNTLDRNYLNLVKKHPTYLSLALKELSNLTDRRIALQSLHFEPTVAEDNMILQGIVRSADTPPEIILAEFMKDLEASSMFSGIIAERHNKRRENGIPEMEFVLRLRGNI